MKKKLLIVFFIIGIVLSIFGIYKIIVNCFIDKIPLCYYCKIENNLFDKYVKHGDFEVIFKLDKKVDKDLKSVEIYYPEALESTNKMYPVIIFQNNNTMPLFKYIAILRHLSTHGYIVVTNNNNNNYSSKTIDKLYKYMTDNNNNENSIFYQKIDFKNIGIVGFFDASESVINNAIENKERYNAIYVVNPKVNNNINNLETSIFMVNNNDLYDKVKGKKAIFLTNEVNKKKLIIDTDYMMILWFKYNFEDNLDILKLNNIKMNIY